MTTIKKIHVKRMLIRTIIILACIFFLIVIVNVISLASVRSNEKFPADTFFNTEQNRSALIVVAHDDDAVLFAGTSSMLAEKGWKINFLCFYTDKWRPEDNPVRKEEMVKVKNIQGLNDLMLVDLTLRIGLDTIKEPWKPIPYSAFAGSFRIDSLRHHISAAIELTNPSVIFMADKDFGFYGHPEHVLVGRTIEKICMERTDSAAFPVKKLYQVVLPSRHASKIMGDRKDIKAIYPTSGMPEPDIEIDILPYAKKKMRVLKAHASQHRNLKKFLPYYHYYPARVYFRIFRKEYFNIIDIELE